MNKFQLLKTLHHHVKLSEKRSPIYEQNKVAKFFTYLAGCFVIVYLMFLSVFFALIVNDDDSMTSYEFLMGIVPFMLVADFFVRFVAQQTPSQLVKPYLLLPIPKYTCVECFLYNSMLSTNNLIWLAFTLPYVIMTTIFSYGFFAALGLLVAIQLMVVVNSQWYMLARTLINKNLLWWLLPVCFYALVLLPLFIDKYDLFFDFFTSWGEGFAYWHPLNYLIVLVVLCILLQINKRVQYKFTYNEAAGKEERKLKKVSEFKFLDRYGEIGEYVKLEIKSLMRNKNLRKTFIAITLLVVALSLLISLTDVYSDNFSRAFWVVYIFVIYNASINIKIMGYEGNYIDCLMVHKENIMQLLTAKYYFYTFMLLLPFLIMLPTVFTGKYTILMLTSMLMLAAGPATFVIMQMAVYNKQSVPLNSKLIGKGGMENSYLQLVANLIVLFLPFSLISLLKLFFIENMTFLILLIFSSLFVVAHRLWIGNIYHRMMKRRYENIEGFRASR